MRKDNDICKSDMKTAFHFSAFKLRAICKKVLLKAFFTLAIAYSAVSVLSTSYHFCSFIAQSYLLI